MVLLTFVAVQGVGLAFTVAGLSPWAAGLVLIASLLGSLVDLPVARLTSDRPGSRYRREEVEGIVYLIPVPGPARTVVAVNLGGAAIPPGSRSTWRRGAACGSRPAWRSPSWPW